MKTTIDLPDELVREVKIYAAKEGRKIKDVVADLIVAGLAAHAGMKKASPPRKDSLKLPLFPCGDDAPATGMSIEQLLELEQESQVQEDLARLGLTL